MTLVLALTLSLAACGQEDPANEHTDAAPITPSGSCSLLGAWNVHAANVPQGMTINIKSDMTSVLSYAGGASSVVGSWSLSGNQLTLVDQSVTGTAHSCGTTPGTYALTYASDCRSVSLAVVNDACAGRAQFVNGATLNR
jgi:hypothetical protein